MKLAREFGRPDWRAMLAGMSSTEYGDWKIFYRDNFFMMRSWMLISPGCSTPSQPCFLPIRN
jgi:phage tail assembly protein T